MKKRISEIKIFADERHFVKWNPYRKMWDLHVARKIISHHEFLCNALTAMHVKVNGHLGFGDEYRMAVPNNWSIECK